MKREKVKELLYRKKEAFSKLEYLKKKGIVTDYDVELAAYKDEKYNHRK